MEYMGESKDLSGWDMFRECSGSSGGVSHHF
jgi:hypothetical protein